ncbi:MAG TPA: hypothetical protein VGV69_10675 [Solirubrobacterales bacterium]|nr:hypothetical protein [Solirubrobacterales bacterium]
MPAAVRLPLLCCVLVAALLVGCGGEGPDSTGEATVTDRSAETTAPGTTTTAKKQRPERKRRAAPAGGLCQSQVGSFIGSMDSLRRRLAVGVTYDQYVNEVRGIRSTYERLPIEALEVDCLSAVGTPSEKAFNRYIEAANDWGDCVSELGCDTATIEPVLQRRWRIASHFLTEAQDGLRGLAG